MSNILLVTTSLEQTWKTPGQIIFLGHWCNRYNNTKKLDDKKFTILDYQWNDRQKLFKDYKYLKSLNDKLIKKLTNELNKYHGTNFSERYWKIIIGPWLITFIQIVFERYENLNNLFKTKKVDETIIAKIDPIKMVPDNYEKFTRLTLTHTWNHFIYSLILKSDYFKFDIEKRYHEFINEERYEDYLRPKNVSKINKIYESILKIFKKINSNEEVLISESYLGIIDEIKLCLKFKTLPRFDTSYYLPNSKTNENRDKIDLNYDCKNIFEKFICKLIPQQIPKSILEDFDETRIKSKEMNWPEKPKLIFTSHIMPKTLQCMYVAEKMEKFGTKLIHGQHGGVYGQYLFTSMQDYELDVCDKYLSWGWNLPNNNKILPFGIIKNLNKFKFNKKKAKNLLMVLMSRNPYTHRLNSYSGTNQIAKYQEDNINFCKKLDNNILEKFLTLRLHARKFGWNEESVFKSQFPKVKIDNGFSTMHELLNKSRLVLHTYVGTGYLETLASNFPTVVFANLDECLVNEETKEYLKVLEKVKIFHQNYSSAAEFINDNWKNIEEWWNNDETQEARIFFCERFAKINENKVNKLFKVINNQK
tara:strand:+ start:7160 stop:8926 length:1767 start_codon:yes stop_codon:yes gene_type:complete